MVEKPKKVITLNDWKNKGIKEITLPSGVTIKIKRPSMFQLISKDVLPSSLTEFAIKLLDGKAKSDIEKMNQDEIEKVGAYVNKIIPVMVVEPKLTEKDVNELPDEDKFFIFQYIYPINWSSKVDDLKNFRNKRQGSDSSDSSEVLGDKTICHD